MKIRLGGSHILMGRAQIEKATFQINRLEQGGPHPVGGGRPRTVCYLFYFLNDIFHETYISNGARLQPRQTIG